MFNVIKGNLINKNVKAVVIPNEIKKETLRNHEEEFQSSVQNFEKDEELFFSRENIEDEDMEIEENLESEIDKLTNILLEKKKELSLLEEEIDLKLKNTEVEAQRIVEEAQENARNEINDIKIPCEEISDQLFCNGKPMKPLPKDPPWKKQGYDAIGGKNFQKL